MRNKKINFHELIRPFENKWIALSTKNNSVLVAEDSLKLLIEKMDKFNRSNFEIMKIPPFKPLCAFLNEI